MSEEQPLPGLVSRPVRVADTVRKPRGPASAALEALLTRLEEVGFDGAPRWRGSDAEGRDTVDWIGGFVPARSEEGRLGETALASVGRLLRRYHDAIGDWSLPDGVTWPMGPRTREADMVVCHGDVAPRNTVFQGDLALAFIDWDGAFHAPALWDLAYAVWQFAPTTGEAELAERGFVEAPDRVARALALVGGYGAAPGLADRLAEQVVRVIVECRGAVAARAEAGEEVFVHLVAEGLQDELARDEATARASRPALAAALRARPVVR